MSREWVDLRFNIGAAYAAVEPRAPARSDDLLLIETGRQLAGHPLDWGVYLIGQSFIDRPEEPLNGASERADSYQFEGSVTIGVRSQATVWGIPVPRVGLGYRFGDGLGVWRFVIGAPF